MPNLPWPTSAADLRMFVRPPRATRRPVSGGLPFRGRLFLSVTSTGAPVVGVRYANGANTGSANVTYSSNQQNFGQIAAFSIQAGTDLWNFAAATVIFFQNKYYFLSQTLQINGVGFTVAGIGDVVGNSFGPAMTVTLNGIGIGSLNFAASGAVSFVPTGAQQGVGVSTAPDDQISWTFGGQTFSGYPTILGVNNSGGPTLLTGGYVGIATGRLGAEVDWEASGQGPVGDEPIPAGHEY